MTAKKGRGERSLKKYINKNLFTIMLVINQYIANIYLKNFWIFLLPIHLNLL